MPILGPDEPRLLGYPLQDEVDWPLVVRALLMFRRRWRLSDGTSVLARLPARATAVFAEVGHVVHAAKHAAIRGLGDRKFLGSEIAEGANGKLWVPKTSSGPVNRMNGLKLWSVSIPSWR